ncbi:MAG: sigma 54-interacting transcriptional regulator, partial [Thermodesulfovibrionales bacterium]|nr:sigma 54-interacting transcriptional regulator [Thermodesulfovibrionales bacterium]
KEIERVGDHHPIHVNTRLITATNKDLSHLIKSGKFREDLFYRINVIPIQTPPLREKKEDIPILVSHFLKRISRVNQKNIQRVSSSAMKFIESYGWSGNVRQLINALEFAAITCKSETIDVVDLPDYIFNENKKSLSVNDSDERERYDTDLIISTLKKCSWNRTLTAKNLGISRVTLWKIMKELRISRQ